MRPPVIPASWPFRTASRHVASAPHLWHVQEVGTDGPVLLLLHGAGGATHSFRHLIPLLSPAFRVVAIDLPGQGFTVSGARSRSGIDAMAEDIGALCAQEGWHPAAIVGHSAGAAIALRLAETMPTGAVVGINAALGNFEGVSGWVFPIMARFLAMAPLVARVFSRFAATPAQARSLLRSTGSRIDPAGEAQYLHLLRMPSHVGATLDMMAQWNLDGLLMRLPRQTARCLLVTASNDRAVPPSVSARAAQEIPSARLADLPGYGHLVHEEAAPEVASLIRAFVGPPSR